MLSAVWKGTRPRLSVIRVAGRGSGESPSSLRVPTQRTDTVALSFWPDKHATTWARRDMHPRLHQPD
ncbi:hypothetical protein VTK56DRAFT_8599 [Thermocarpiscus australiensis]